MTPKVTVTVPVYKVEKYLRKCLDSLAVQTLKEIEFILVDDCSPDSSGAICDEYSARDSRFLTIHRSENGGSSAARQAGLSAARGQYVIVCDSDDWVEPDAYELLYENAVKNDADISICDYYCSYENGKEVIAHYEYKGQSQEMLIRDALSQRLSPASWVKMVRRDFMSNNGIDYEPGINQGEDALILSKLLLHNPKVVKIDKPLYHWRRIMTGDSYTNAPKYASFQQMLRIRQWQLDNFDHTLYARELFGVAINISYTGLRIKDMPVKEHKAFMRENCPFRLFFKYRRFDIKAMVIMVSKVSRTIGAFLHKRFSKLFYEKPSMSDQNKRKIRDTLLLLWALLFWWLYIPHFVIYALGGGEKR